MQALNVVLALCTQLRCYASSLPLLSSLRLISKARNVSGDVLRSPAGPSTTDQALLPLLNFDHPLRKGVQ